MRSESDAVATNENDPATEAEPTKPLSHKPRRGSETRRRQRRISIRVTDDEYKQVEDAAVAKGLTVVSYAREHVVSAPQTRSRRRPHVDVAAFAKTYGELNRIGGNINQIARAVNSGDQLDAAAMGEAIDALRDTLDAIRAAMGFQS